MQWREKERGRAEIERDREIEREKLYLLNIVDDVCVMCKYLAAACIPTDT